jgi:hypothetical protein
MIDAAGFFGMSLRGQDRMLKMAGHSKNSGGGIAPAAIAALIEGSFCSVNAFRAPKRRPDATQLDLKLLTRLNFRSRPGNGWPGIRGAMETGEA